MIDGAATPDGAPPWRIGNEKIKRETPCSAVPLKRP
jgi:hypothetical protein